MNFMEKLIGKKIKTIRINTPKEAIDNGWKGESFQVIVLEGGAKLYPSKDEEGNGPGALFGMYKKKSFGIY